MKVPIAKTALEPADLQAVLKPLESGWLVQGPFVREFEEAWSDFTGAKHSVAVTSCTSAMQISLCALGFPPSHGFRRLTLLSKLVVMWCFVT